MTNPPEVQLLACPFCPDGGEPHRDGGWTFCLKCGVGFEGPNSDQQWNTRSSDPSVVQQWIACEERLPEELDTVVVLWRWGGEPALAYTATSEWCDNVTGKQLKPPPYFWMPIPPLSPADASERLTKER